MTPRDIALALCPPLLWGIAFPLAKPAIEHFPPIFMMALTYGMTAICLYRPAKGMRTPFIAMLAIAALGGSIQAACIYSGLAGLMAGTAVLVMQASVPFAILCAWAIGRERLDARRCIGIVVSLAGVLLIVGMPESPDAMLPLLLVMAGALSWAMAQAMIRAVGRDDGRTVTGAIGLLAAPQCLMLSLLLERGQLVALRTAGAGDWIALAAFALTGFVVSYSIWYHLLQRFRIDQVAPFTLLMPLVGVLSSAVMLGERMSLPVVAGGAIILAGLAIVVRAPAGAAAES